MLGNIQYFFRNIKKPMTKDPDKDLLFIEINNNLCKILNQQGIQEFREKNDCFSEIVSRKKIETFRNPPAHTNYLPYKIACQCRDYFNDMILRIDSMLLS